MGGVAELSGGDPCQAAVVPATIHAIDDEAGTVAFATRSASRTGDPHERLLRTFTVPRSHIHDKPIKGAPSPVALVPGATGNLFLSRKGLQATSEDGFAIHGADDASLKWPQCAGTPRWLSKLAILPTSIAIRGHLKGESAFVELDLLKAEAEDAQSIRWNSAAHVAIRLTARGARQVGLKAKAQTVELWPIWMKIKGSPVIDPSVTGEIDLLDPQMAEGEQQLVFDRRGTPIGLWVTHDGCHAFHVTPQLVAEQSGSGARASSLCYGCAKQGSAHARARASRAARGRVRGDRAAASR
jgi:hypothetical protein